jgi:translation elongation factor EF-Tu-like GTPase
MKVADIYSFSIGIVFIFSLGQLALLDGIVTSAYRDGYVSDNIKMNVLLIVPIAMSEMVRFAIRKGSKMVRLSK